MNRQFEMMVDAVRCAQIEEEAALFEARANSYRAAGYEEAGGSDFTAGASLRQKAAALKAKWADPQPEVQP